MNDVIYFFFLVSLGEIGVALTNNFNMAFPSQFYFILAGTRRHPRLFSYS